MDKIITHFIGLDLSDTSICYAVIDTSGQIVDQSVIGMCETQLRGLVRRFPQARIALETGQWSRFVLRVLKQANAAEVHVLDARHLAVIAENPRKSDMQDAVLIARLIRFDDLALVRTVDHRNDELQIVYASLKLRDNLVSARTQLINAARGIVKSFGERFRSGGRTESFHKFLMDITNPMLRQILQPYFWALAEITNQIQAIEAQLEQVADQSPLVQNLQTAPRVGKLTALCFMAVIQDPSRFECGRDCAAYVGLVTGRAQSGKRDPKRGITKTGNKILRKYLVSAAYAIMTFGKGSELKDFAMRLKRHKPPKVVAVAVARKLCTILWAMWTQDAPFRPYRNAIAAC